MGVHVLWNALLMFSFGMDIWTFQVLRRIKYSTFMDTNHSNLSLRATQTSLLTVDMSEAKCRGPGNEDDVFLREICRFSVGLVWSGDGKMGENYRLLPLDLPHK